MVGMQVCAQRNDEATEHDAIRLYLLLTYQTEESERPSMCIWNHNIGMEKHICSVMSFWNTHILFLGQLFPIEKEM